MVDSLIAINDEDPELQQLPANVRAEIDRLFMATRNGQLVHLAGEETISGAKTFTAAITAAKAVHISNFTGDVPRLRMLHSAISRIFDLVISESGELATVNITTGQTPLKIDQAAITDALRILVAAVTLGVDLDMGGNDIINVGNANAPNGLLQLDGNGRIANSQLSVDIMQFKGTWNAATNTPSLVDATGSPGDVYRVSTAGSVDLGSGVQSFAVGDWVVLNSSLIWEKSDMTDAVVSVAGLNGVITASALRAALDLEIGIDVQAHSARLAGMVAASIGSGSKILYTTDAGTTWVELSTASFGRSLLAQPDAAAVSALLPTSINPQIGTNYGLVLADAQKLVTMDNAAANTVTVPLNSTQAFPVGTTINVMQKGAGQTSFVATGGVTIHSDTAKLKVATQYAGATLTKIGTDEWWLTGALIA